jgi:hypothetical protein
MRLVLPSAPLVSKGGADGSGNLRCPGVNLTVREPTQPNAEHPERQLTLAVVLEGLTPTVRSVAVGLDRQLLLPPQKVDREPADANIDLGVREAVAAA